jgi:hypothetical protein
MECRLFRRQRQEDFEFERNDKLGTRGKKNPLLFCWRRFSRTSPSEHLKISLFGHSITWS